ncbi:MAG: hypothetical protein V3T77_00665, partial [Planctomycetota bacterium]
MATRKLLAFSTLAVLLLAPLATAMDEIPDDAVLKAMVDELKRSMSLKLADLEKPYFIQYSVQDTVSQRISASYGALQNSNRSHNRSFSSQVRTGSYELDNTNFSGGAGRGFGGRRGRGRPGGGGGRGGGAMLPIDDNYTAIRQAIWLAT